MPQSASLLSIAFIPIAPSMCPGLSTQTGPSACSNPSIQDRTVHRLAPVHVQIPVYRTVQYTDWPQCMFKSQYTGQDSTQTGPSACSNPSIQDRTVHRLAPVQVQIPVKDNWKGKWRDLIKRVVKVETSLKRQKRVSVQYYKNNKWNFNYKR